MKTNTLLYGIIGFLVLVLITTVIYLSSSSNTNPTIQDTMMKENGMNMPTEEDGDDAMREHCKMMPQMAGCEKYN